MKKFELGEVKKTVLKVKKNLRYNENITIKFIVVDYEYTEVLVAVKNIDYEVMTIDFKGIFDLPSLYEWINLEIESKVKSILQDYIYKR